MHYAKLRYAKRHNKIAFENFMFASYIKVISQCVVQIALFATSPIGLEFE